MRTKAIFYGLVCGAALLVTAVPALRAADTAAPAARTSDEKVKKTPLDDHMEAIEESMKKLRRTLRKAELQGESLELIARVEQEAIASKILIPARATTLPEADRAKFITAYRKDMAGFIAQVLLMEQAVLDNDSEKALTIYKGLKTVEDDSHDKYMPEDEKEKAKSDSK